jgi:hypothetical protein
MRRIGLTLLLLAAACERSAKDVTTEDAAPSPNASILPAPLAGPPTSETPLTPPTATSLPKIADAAAQPSALASAFLSIAPEPMRGDREIPPDTLSSKETAGITFTAEWRWLDAPAPPKANEVHAEGLAAARKLTALRTQVSLGESGRLRLVFDGRAFPLPLGTELRSRVDRLGHALVFPGATEYRPVPPGALRALFGDRRLDVIPLVPGELTPHGNVPARGGQTARRVDVVSRMGTLTLDLERVVDAGLGGPLLCRALVELVEVDPSSSVCVPFEVPVRAQMTWAGGGTLLFEAGDLSKRTELSLGDLSCPPPSSSLAATVVPPLTSGLLLTREDLAAFRTRPIDVGPAAPGAPAEGLLAKNATDSIRYLFLDGVPVVWLMPGAEQLLPGPLKGRYVAQWRSFLGDAIDPARPLEIPGRSAVGEPIVTPDAGAPPPAPKPK